MSDPSATHPIGRYKAVFFHRFGFTLQRWNLLSEALISHAARHEVSRIEDSPFGKRYLGEGILPSPDGRTPLVRSVWFIEAGQDLPRFITAYPLEGETDDR